VKFTNKLLEEQKIVKLLLFQSAILLNIDMFKLNLIVKRPVFDIFFI